MNDEKALEESAKAVQEVAKTTGKAIDASENLGGFIAKYISGSLDQAMGIVEDRLRYMRWERKIRLMKRAEQIAAQHGLAAPTRAVPLKLAVPLLEAASMEDNDALQDAWATLLINAADETSGVTLQRAYIDILESLTPLDAVILSKVYSVPISESRHVGVVTESLPEAARAARESEYGALKEPAEDVKLSLANLVRLGCLTFGRSFGGGELYVTVMPTLLGEKFLEACTLRRRT